MAIIDLVDEALNKWVDEISADKYQAPLQLIQFVEDQASNRLRELLLEALNVPKTVQIWPPRKHGP